MLQREIYKLNINSSNKIIEGTEKRVLGGQLTERVAGKVRLI